MLFVSTYAKRGARPSYLCWKTGWTKAYHPESLSLDACPARMLHNCPHSRDLHSSSRQGSCIIATVRSFLECSSNFALHLSHTSCVVACCSCTRSSQSPRTTSCFLKPFLIWSRQSDTSPLVSKLRWAALAWTRSTREAVAT